MAALSLKAQNVVPLSMLTVFFLIVAHWATKGSITTEQLSSLAPTASALAVAGVISVWLTYLIPADLKHRLVFLRIKNVLPGHRFIQLAEKDARIDSEQLNTEIKNIAEMKKSPAQQNQYWYKAIYRPLGSEPEVASIHKSFLLYRDAASVALICLIFFGIGQAVIPELSVIVGLTGLGTIAAFMVFFLLAANTAGNRFVTTSVAVFLFAKEE
ncbi:MAG: hypothetical protein JAZ06_09240 [Candidatus Thiodiazotropha taylori]|nr:hypothetical protein [Candidatus Thiodiazotropha taylori]